MATKRPAPRNFTGLLDDVPTPGAPATSDKPAKGPLLTFHIDEDLKLLLDRVVHHTGRKGSQRAVINLALRAMLSADPRSQQPIPGE